MWRYGLVFLGLTLGALAWADPSPDFNGDGQLNVFDVIAVVYCVVGIECPNAEVNLTELVDGDMVRWNAGEGEWQTVTPESLKTAMGLDTELSAIQEQITNLSNDLSEYDRYRIFHCQASSTTVSVSFDPTWCTHEYTASECGGELPSGECLTALRRAQQAANDQDWRAVGPGETFGYNNYYTGPGIENYNSSGCSGGFSGYVDYLCIVE